MKDMMESFVNSFDFNVFTNESTEKVKHDFCVKTAKENAEIYIYDYSIVFDVIKPHGIEYLLTNFLKKSYSTCYNMLIKYEDDFRPPYYAAPFGYLVDMEDYDYFDVLFAKIFDIILVDLYETTNKQMTLDEFVTKYSKDERHISAIAFSRKHVHKHFRNRAYMADNMPSNEQFRTIYNEAFMSYHFKLEILNVMNHYD